MALLRVNVTVESSEDELGRQLFFPLGVGSEQHGKYDPTFWFYKYAPYSKVGVECCSQHWVATHYIPIKNMHRIFALETGNCQPDPNFFPFLTKGYQQPF